MDEGQTARQQHHLLPGAASAGHGDGLPLHGDDDTPTPQLPSRVEAPRDRRTVQDPNGPPDIDVVYASFVNSPQWSTEAITTLFARLERQRPVQARVMRQAAAEGRVISRD